MSHHPQSTWPFVAPFPPSSDGNTANQPPVDLQDSTQLQMAFSHNSQHSNSQLFLTPMPQGGADQAQFTSIASLPATPSRQQSNANWAVNQYAQFPVIREDTQLSSQVNSYHTPLPDNGNNMAFPWTLNTPGASMPIIAPPTGGQSNTNDASSSVPLIAVPTPDQNIVQNDVMGSANIPSSGQHPAMMMGPNSTQHSPAGKGQHGAKSSAPSTPTGSSSSSHPNGSPNGPYGGSNTPFDTANPWNHVFPSEAMKNDNRQQGQSSNPQGNDGPFVSGNGLIPLNHSENGPNNGNGPAPQQSVAGGPVLAMYGGDHHTNNNNNNNHHNNNNNNNSHHHGGNNKKHRASNNHHNNNNNNHHHQQSQQHDDQIANPFPGLHPYHQYYYPTHPHQHQGGPPGATPPPQLSPVPSQQYSGYPQGMFPYPIIPGPGMIAPQQQVHTQFAHPMQQQQQQQTPVQQQQQPIQSIPPQQIQQLQNGYVAVHPQQIPPQQQGGNTLPSGANTTNTNNTNGNQRSNNEQGGNGPVQQQQPNIGLYDLLTANQHHLPSMCTSQHGARSLQAELDYTSNQLKQPHLVQKLFFQLLPFMFRLSVHPFANYVVQKLIDNLPDTNESILYGNQVISPSGPNSPSSANSQQPNQPPTHKTPTTFTPLLPPQPLYTPAEEWNEELQQRYDDAQLGSISVPMGEGALNQNTNAVSQQPPQHHHHHHHPPANGTHTTQQQLPQPWSGLSMHLRAPPLPTDPEITPQYYCLLMLRSFDFGAGLFSLCTDPFGCRVVQKIIDVFAFSHQKEVAAATAAAVSNGTVVPLSSQANTARTGPGRGLTADCHAKLNPILREAYGLIYHHVAPHFYTFSVHQHANHVIQKCIETIPGFLNHPIFIPLFYPKIHQYSLYQKFLQFEQCAVECKPFDSLTNNTLPALPLLPNPNGGGPSDKSKKDGKRSKANSTTKDGVEVVSSTPAGANHTTQHAICGPKGGIYLYTQDSELLGQFKPSDVPIPTPEDDAKTELLHAAEDVMEDERAASYKVFYRSKDVFKAIDPLLNSSFTTFATTPVSYRGRLERLTRMMGHQQRQLLQQQRERERHYAQQQQQQQKAAQQPLSNGFILGMSNNYGDQAMGLDRFNNDSKNDLWYYLGQAISLNEEAKLLAKDDQATTVDVKKDAYEEEDEEDEDDEYNDNYDFTTLPPTAEGQLQYKKHLLTKIQERDDLYYSQFPFIYSSTSSIQQNKKLLFHQLFATNLHDGYHLNAFTSLSTHTYGCRVIQRIYTFCNDQQQRDLLLQQITESFLPLVQDLFGNYVIQHILTCGALYDVQHIASLLRGNVLAFAMNKCSSNVVEKALQSGNATIVEGLIQELMTPIVPSMINKKTRNSAIDGENVNGNGAKADGLHPSDLQIPLVSMIAHPFANYVVQTMLSVCLHEQKNNLIALIKRVSPHIELNECSKKILHRVDPRFGPVTSSGNNNHHGQRRNNNNNNNDRSNNNHHTGPRHHHNNNDRNNDRNDRSVNNTRSSNNNNNDRNNNNNQHHSHQQQQQPQHNTNVDYNNTSGFNRSMDAMNHRVPIQAQHQSMPQQPQSNHHHPQQQQPRQHHHQRQNNNQNQNNLTYVDHNNFQQQSYNNDNRQQQQQQRSMQQHQQQQPMHHGNNPHHQQHQQHQPQHQQSVLQQQPFDVYGSVAWPNQPQQQPQPQQQTNRSLGGYGGDKRNGNRNNNNNRR